MAINLYMDETMDAFKNERARVEELRKRKDETYIEEKRKLESWMNDYDVGVGCCWNKKYLCKIRQEPNEIRRQNIMIDARRAS